MGGFTKVIIGIIWIILYYLLFVMCKKSQKGSASYLIIILLLIPLIIFNISGDYFNHISVLNSITYYDFNVARFLEPPYVWAAKISLPNYWLWRLIVWGFGVWVISLALKNFGLLTPYYFALFFVLIIACFSAPRGYVANAVIMLGISMIYRYKGIKGFVLGIVILLSSILFHRQSIILLVLLPFIYYLKPNRRNVVMLFLIGLAMVMTVRGYIDDIISSLVVDKTDSSLASQYGDRFQVYLGNDAAAGMDTSPSAILTSIINYLIYFYTIVFYFRNFSKIKVVLPNVVLFLLNSSVVLIVLSVLMGIVTGGFQAIAYRVLGLALMPILFMVLMMEKANVFTSYTKNAKRMFIIMQLWIFIYMIYCNLVNPTFSETKIIM